MVVFSLEKAVVFKKTSYNRINKAKENRFPESVLQILICRNRRNNGSNNCNDYSNDNHQ